MFFNPADIQFGVYIVNNIRKKRNVAKAFLRPLELEKEALLSYELFK
jgi:hypothetical protein